MDKVEGILEVGTNETHEVVINHPDLKPDENGVGHVVFSPVQALTLAKTLTKQAGIAIQARQESQADTQEWVIACIIYFANGFKNTRQLARANKAQCLEKLTRLVTRGCSIVQDDVGGEMIREMRVVCMPLDVFQQYND